MAFDKDFVVKNGIQVNQDLIYANSDTKKVGIGTTEADKKLVVIGDVEASESLSVGTTVTAERGVFTGILTANDGLDVGIGGTVLSVTTLDKKIGIGSTSPVYTLDLYGPVSTGTTAAFIFGDVEVTGNIKATELSGQIAAGGTVSFTNVTVDKTLNANNTEVFTLFRVEEFNSNQFRFLAGGDPVSIGFTENKINPDIYLLRGHNYKFDVDSGGFPFYIKTEATADLDNQYNDGVEGNGTQVGFVTFKVPFNAPNELFYQASNVAGMGGKIIVNTDGKNLTVGFLTVTDTADIKNLEVEFLNVTGIGTIKNIVSDDFSVSAGIVTALRFVGVATGANQMDIHRKSDNINYKVLFTEDLSVDSNYQDSYIDSESDQLTYNPFTNILSCDRFVGNVSGVATGADNVNIDQVNNDTQYQITFTNTNSSDYERLYIDSNNSHLSYNPSLNKLFVTNISSTDIEASTFTGDLSGTATNANFVNVDTKGDNVNYQVIFNDNQGDDYERLYIDSESGKFIYNPSTNTLTVDNFVADTITANNINASVTGTIDNANNVNLRPRNDVNAVHYVTFGTAVSGNQRLNTDTGLTYNPATNTLTANFAGLSGSSSKVNIAESNVNEEFQILFSKNQATGAQTPLIDSVSGQFTYNPNTNVLNAGNIVGNGSGLTNLNAGQLTSGIINNARLNKGTTSVAGIVKLSDSANSTSSVLAASSKAVDNVRLIASNADNLKTGTVDNARLIAATVNNKGIVRLSNLINGTSTTKAATEFALSQVRQLIDSGVVDPTSLPEASLNSKGIVQLSIATNSDSTTLAATPKSINDLRKIAADAENLTSGIVNNARLNSATTTNKGIVRLSNRTNGDSTTQAATEFALNEVRKLINTGGVDFPDASLTQKGIVRLSNSTNTDSNTLAATPTAINNLRKIAADADNLTAGTVNNARLNSATVNNKGIVRLSNRINGDSTTQAATEFALNQVRLLINTGGVDFPDASLTQKGIVQLSNSTNTDDNTKAATPTAINSVRKIAADADNLTEGTVSRARLPQGSTSNSGIVKLSSVTNGDSVTLAASEKAINNVRKIAADADNLATGEVNVARLPKSSTTTRGIVQLSNQINGTETNKAATEFALNEVRKLIDSGVVDPTTLPEASLNTKGIVQLSNSTNSDSITLAATPKAINELRKIAADADNLTTGTVGVARLPKAATNARGIVQLSNSTNGDSTTKAATEFALSQVKDLIPNIVINDASLTVKGIVQLSNSTNSDSITLAATPKAINELRKIAANADNLSAGTVSVARLPKAGLSARGIVQTSNSINTDDNDVAASSTAVNSLRKVAADADNLSTGTVNNARLNSATINNKGIVKLSNRTNGDSQTLAVTEFALSQVKDLIPIVDIKNASLTQRGIVQLSNSTNTDDNTKAATPTAINTVRKLATDADNLTSGEVNVARLPKAATNARGIVQLSNLTNGTSTTKAVTEFALSQVKDSIPNIVINDASLTVKGIVQLNNATNSTNQTTAATPKAVNAVRLESQNASNLKEGKVKIDLIQDASTVTQGVVKLNNSINSVATFEAATPKAVNDARLAAKNADNLSSGTVGRSLLPSATTGAKGVTQLYATFPPTSTSNNLAATAGLVKKVYDSAQKQIPSGSIMLFYQAGAPTGWTKITSQNNKAIRVVSGTGGGGGGNNTFTTTFGNRSVPLPSHTHTASSGDNDSNHRHDGTTKNNEGSHFHGLLDLGHTHFIANSAGAVSSPNGKAKLNSTTSAGSQGFGGSGTLNEKRDYVLEKSSNANANVGLTSKVETGITVTVNNSNHKHTFTSGLNKSNHKHPITVNSAGTASAQIDMRVQYINVIICKKN